MVGSFTSLTQFQKIVRTQLFSEPPMEYIVPSERFILTSDPDYMELSGLNRNSTYIKIEHSKSGFELAQKLRKEWDKFYQENNRRVWLDIYEYSDSTNKVRFQANMELEARIILIFLNTIICSLIDKVDSLPDKIEVKEPIEVDNGFL